MRLSFTFPPLRALAVAAGVATVALGMLVMLGWQLRLPALIQIHPKLVPMQYNAATSFVLAGVGLLFASGKCWHGTLLLGSTVGLIGGLTLAQHLLNIDLGLDQLFMQHYITIATPQPGRMAPNTALCFTLTGIALWIAGLERCGKRRWQAVSLLSSLMVGLGFVALIGYLLGIPTAYGWGNLTHMALHAALGFMVLGGGLIALSWQSEMVERDWRPWGIGVTTATVTITLWQALHVVNARSTGLAEELMLAFGLIMAFALAHSVADSQKLRRAADATRNALALLSQEIAERKKIEEQVRQMAFHDALTQLPNRRLLTERLSQALVASKRSGCFGAVMFLDLDNFKPLNDTHGHGIGDLLLIEVATRLTRCVREIDTVARFGGDEFVVLLNELEKDGAESAAQARLVASKICAALSEPYHLAVCDAAEADTTVAHRCTASIGIALFTQQEVSQDDILKRADAAMYQAKASGRNRVLFYEPSP